MKETYVEQKFMRSSWDVIGTSEDGVVRLIPCTLHFNPLRAWCCPGMRGS